MGLFEERDGIAFQVMDTRITCPQVALPAFAALLPIYTMGKIAEYQPDQVGVFPLDWGGHSRQRVIAAIFSEGYLGFAQCLSNDRGYLFDSADARQAVDPYFIAPSP